MTTRLTRLSLAIGILAEIALGQESFCIKMLNGYATVKGTGGNKYVEVGWQTTLERGFGSYMVALTSEYGNGDRQHLLA
jgi:hypothetical protein